MRGGQTEKSSVSEHWDNVRREILVMIVVRMTHCFVVFAIVQKQMERQKNLEMLTSETAICFFRQMERQKTEQIADFCFFF